jgi:hypothetical protein
MSQPVVVSIDWDFFVRMPRVSGTTMIRGGEVANALIYDWGHSESSVLAPLADAIWVARGLGLDSAGLDIEKEITFFREGASGVLEWLDGHQETRRSWSDSHLGIVEMLGDLSRELGPLRVISFDAHHDLGYSEHEVMAAKGGRINAGSWLRGLLDNGVITEAEIVFPPWIEDQEKEAENSAGAAFLDWPELPELPEEIAGIYLARSGAWAPPFLDPQFLRLAEDLGFDPETWDDGPLVRDWTRNWPIQNAG